MEEIEINVLPIFIGIVILLVFCIGGMLLNQILHHFLNKDKKLDIKVLKEKYPLVSEEFMLKSTEAQLIENNQEIHEINKRIEEQTKSLDKIEELMKEIEAKYNNN